VILLNLSTIDSPFIVDHLDLNTIEQLLTIYQLMRVVSHETAPDYE